MANQSNRPGPQVGTLTKVLALIGAALLFLVLLSPVFFAVPTFLARRRFHFDYLMPAELFPVVLLGGAMLLWAAWRAHTDRALIGGSLAAAAACLVASQAIAVVTGLASGEVPATGWRWGLVLGCLGLYVIAVLFAAVGGVHLARDPSTRPGRAAGWQAGA
jgi:hypothetical protein